MRRVEVEGLVVNAQVDMAGNGMEVYGSDDGVGRDGEDADVRFGTKCAAAVRVDCV